MRSCRLPLAPNSSITDLSLVLFKHRGSGVISLNHQILRQRKASKNGNTANRSPSESETTSVHMEITLPRRPGRKKPQTKENLAAVITQYCQVLPGAAPFHRSPWKCQSLGIGDCTICQKGKENHFHKLLIVKSSRGMSLNTTFEPSLNCRIVQCMIQRESPFLASLTGKKIDSKTYPGAVTSNWIPVQSAFK